MKKIVLLLILLFAMSCKSSDFATSTTSNAKDTKGQLIVHKNQYWDIIKLSDKHFLAVPRTTVKIDPVVIDLNNLDKYVNN